MAANSNINIRVDAYSWARYSPLNQVLALSGIDLLNPKTVSWFGTFQPPDLQNRDGDIEYTLQDGDRLDRISQQYYGNVSMWWVIAARNDLDLPDVQIIPGRKIIIPDPTYVITNLVNNPITVER